MSSNHIFNNHYNHRKRGFYFWTMKKNFLSLYIWQSIIEKKKTFDDLEYFFEIFSKVISRIISEPDFEQNKEKFMKRWNSQIIPKFYTKNSFPIKNISFIDGSTVYSNWLLKYLYNHSMSVEEFFAYMCSDAFIYDNFYDALLIFSYECEIIDDINSHCSKIYTYSVFFPIKSLYCNNLVYKQWNRFLNSRQIANFRNV